MDSSTAVVRVRRTAVARVRRTAVAGVRRTAVATPIDTKELIMRMV